MFPFLNGLRGVAALAVCYTHANHLFPLRNDAYHHIGEQAVLLFFVLSSFLLSYRFLIDWKRLQDWKEEKKLPWYHWSWELREVAKYFLRRFFRIYPAYFTTCLFIASNNITKQGYKWGTKDLLGQHLILRHTKHNLWTVPVEVSFYFCLPLLAILYYSCSRVDFEFEIPHLRGWVGRLLNTNTIRLYVRILFLVFYGCILYGLTLITLWERETPQRKQYFSDIDFFLPEYLATFCQGMVYGILFFELHNVDLLPRTVDKKPKQIVLPLRPTDIKGSYQPFSETTLVLPSYITYGLRTITDMACYVLLVLSLFIDGTAMKHYRYVFPGLGRPEDSEVVQGLYHGAILFFGLFSDKSFSRLFQWNLLTYAGKISFSLYLLHPFAQQLIFNTVFGPRAVQYNYMVHDYPDSNFFDLFIISMSITWLIATISYKLIEEPAGHLCKYIIHHYIADYTKED
jgi:peptidoglycan/LPS O-acetylase OafA/YrhL